MEQLTTEQAIEFGNAKKWEPMSFLERAKFQMAQDKLCMPFDVFHDAITEALGRTVYTHEFGLNREGLLRELDGHQSPPSLAEIIVMVPAEKRLVVVVDGK